MRESCHAFLRRQIPLTTKFGIVFCGDEISCSNRVRVNPSSLTRRRAIGLDLKEVHYEGVSRQRTLNVERPNCGIPTAMTDPLRVNPSGICSPSANRVLRENG